MTLSLTSRPAIRGRVIPRLPATMQAAGGLSVTKENGTWTFQPDWSQLPTVTITDAASQQVWVFNSTTNVYGRASIQALINATFGSSQVVIPIANVHQFTSDVLAAAGGVPVGGIYRNGSSLQIRVS